MKTTADQIQMISPTLLSAASAACGHISCFWCVHHSMSGLCESRCPICRHPYIHFPTICQMLHFLLLKMYPVAYKRRENEILEEEMEQDTFSPQLNAQDTFSTMVFESNSSSDPSSARKGEAYANMDVLMSNSQVQDDGIGTLVEISDGNSEVIRNIAVEEKYCKQVSVADVLCLECKQLLFRPVVLNCGHVYCESCVIIPAVEMLKCQVCQTSHPRGLPKVCLELDHFLEEQFPKEYKLRRDGILLKLVDVEHKHPTICMPEYLISLFNGSTGTAKQREPAKQGENLLHWSDRHSRVHAHCGCDSCGIYPIIGDRYRCKDCKERIGFDLCGDCYNTQSKLPGRFNQQHTPEHKFELVRNACNMFRLTLQNNSIVIASEDPENGSPASNLSSDAQENDENDLADPVASHDAGDDQTGSQSTS
ncbi:E3 ubiquitin-protein ligase PRT1 isoform X3 [Quercus lobata]|uniref:E3 ubiquitin-protein ligase PRT1 isoform X3 n=1 Tax=Quercus lobata TaxID=97700 RepID=UPI0012478518|nr:E3 ubiquitin-protein ligase PRT1 isoform X3 [Quercus lobata]